MIIFQIQLVDVKFNLDGIGKIIFLCFELVRVYKDCINNDKIDYIIAIVVFLIGS